MSVSNLASIMQSARASAIASSTPIVKQSSSNAAFLEYLKKIEDRTLVHNASDPNLPSIDISDLHESINKIAIDIHKTNLSDPQFISNLKSLLKIANIVLKWEESLYNDELAQHTTHGLNDDLWKVWTISTINNFIYENLQKMLPHFSKNSEIHSTLDDMIKRIDVQRDRIHTIHRYEQNERAHIARARRREETKESREAIKTALKVTATIAAAPIILPIAVLASIIS